MAEAAPTAERIQSEDWYDVLNLSHHGTPIFLIHDGGGTTFAYNCLEALGRIVYGISNPHFFTGAKFEGGLPEMGRLYSSMIIRTIGEPDFPSGYNAGKVDIVLGGWSLGGMLSLEVAKCLADHESIRVTGILMVDTVYPVNLRGSSEPLSEFEDSADELTENQRLSRACMTEARRMAEAWDVPVWDGHLSGKRPKAVLVRATDRVPSREKESVLDKARERKMLGWENYDEHMFERIIDVEGHHFDIFDFQRVGKTTQAMRKALVKLDDANDGTIDHF